MAAVASIPALGLLIGASLGPIGPLGAWASALLMLAACGCALVFWRRGATLATSSAIAFGFLMGGAALTTDANERALHPSLRQVLDQEFGGFLVEALGPAGRHDPVPTRALLVEDA